MTKSEKDFRIDEIASNNCVDRKIKELNDLMQNTQYSLILSLLCRKRKQFHQVYVIFGI